MGSAVRLRTECKRNLKLGWVKASVASGSCTRVVAGASVMLTSQGVAFWLNMGKCWTVKHVTKGDLLKKAEPHSKHLIVKQKQYGVNPVVFKFNDYSQKLLLSSITMNFGSQNACASCEHLGMSLRWHQSGCSHQQEQWAVMLDRELALALAV